MLLVGDAAGLAYAQSGEGIRPAIESGLLAAATILEAGQDYSSEKLESYRSRLAARFGPARRNWPATLAGYVPEAMTACLSGLLLGVAWFPRRVLLEACFLHLRQPALDCG
jgi:hypothetical protein